MNSEETLNEDKLKRDILIALNGMNGKIDKIQANLDSFKKETDIQLEVIRQGIVANSVRFDQLEVIALDAKSIALTARSQLTILTEEIKTSRKALI